MYTICYNDTAGNNQYTRCNDDDYIVNNVFDIDRFRRNNPDKTITGVFNENDNLIRNNMDEKSQFESICRFFGFEPEDYRKSIIDRNGIEYLFIGFLPHNRKYKARLLRKSDNNASKATLEFVRRYIT